MWLKTAQTHGWKLGALQKPPELFELGSEHKKKLMVCTGFFFQWS